VTLRERGRRGETIIYRFFPEVRRVPMDPRQTRVAARALISPSEPTARQWLEQLRSLIHVGGFGAARVRILHDVLRLDIVGAAGQSLSAYGWAVDPLLRLTLRPGVEPRSPATAGDVSPDEAGPSGGQLVRGQTLRLTPSFRWSSYNAVV
jgi:hypothetical protein